MKEYIVNDCGVITNGNQHIIIKHKDNDWRGIHPIECETAEKDNEWYCECDYNFSNSGIGRPLCFTHSPKYSTEKEAITGEIKKLIVYLKEHMFYDKEYEMYIKQLEEYINKNEQLTFF